MRLRDFLMRWPWVKLGYVACASLRYLFARLDVVGVEPKGSICNLKNLECSAVFNVRAQRLDWRSCTAVNLSPWPFPNIWGLGTVHKPTASSRAKFHLRYNRPPLPLGLSHSFGLDTGSLLFSAIVNSLQLAQDRVLVAERVRRRHHQNSEIHGQRIGLAFFIYAFLWMVFFISGEILFHRHLFLLSFLFVMSCKRSKWYHKRSYSWKL